MELVDIYNDRHQCMNYKKERKELLKGEYRESCFVWIMNDKNEILVQQRLATAKICPNMWETTSGGAKEGETSIEAIKRELNEELGINVNINEMKFIGSYIRVNDYVEVFLLEKKINLNKLRLQPDEVQDTMWIKISAFEELIKKGIANDTGYLIFKNYYDNFHNRIVVFENGVPIYKKV